MNLNNKVALLGSFIAGVSAFLCIYFPLFSRPLAVGIVDHDYFNAWQLAVNTSLRSGEILHWMFWLCGGQPGLGNPQSGALSPFNIIGFFFSPVIQFKLELLINAALGLLGFLLIGKRTTGLYITGLAGFIIWSGNGLMLGRILHGQTTYFTLLLVPIIIFVLIDEYERKNRKLPSTRNIFILSMIFLLILYQDGFHVLIYTSPLLIILATGFAIYSRGLAMLILVFISTFISIILALPRLLPAFFYLSDNPRMVTHVESVAPSTLMELLLNNNQLLYYASVSQSGIDLFRLGYLGYIGLVPILICVLFFSTAKNTLPKWPLFITLLLGGLLSIGEYYQWSLWTLISNLPLLENIRAPFKFIASSFFIIALSVTIASGCLLRRYNLLSGKRITLIANLCLLVFLTILFSWSNWPLLKIALNTIQQPAEVINTEQTFTQINGDFNNSYAIIPENTGLLNCYEPTAYVNHAKPDYDLVRLLNQTGDVDIKLRPNSIIIDYVLSEPDTMIINQNFDNGWKNADNESASLFEEEGLIGLSLSAGSDRLVLVYESRGYNIALLITFLFLMSCLIGYMLSVLKKIRSSTTSISTI